MNVTPNTPPHNSETETRKVLFSFDIEKFTKTIDKFTLPLIKAIEVNVFAHNSDEDGHYIDILHCNLTEKELATLTPEYTMYTGLPKDLYKIGVI